MSVQISRTSNWPTQKSRALRAVNRGIQAQTRATLAEIRRVVNEAFSGSRSVKGGNRKVANAVRSAVYDNSERGSAGIIYSKFGAKRSGGYEDWIAPRLFGATVHPTARKWLLIPLQPNGVSRNAARNAVRSYEDIATRGRRKDLAFVPIRGGRAVLLVRRTKQRSTPLAILVKQVRYPRRASREDFLRHALAGLPGEIAAAQAGGR